MHHPELPVFAFITAFLVLTPLIWHWRSGNVAVIAISLWLFVVDIIYGVNTIVWAGNVNDPMPVWCDITSKIVVGASFALPLATVCICKHLEMVSSSRKVSYDIADRKRRMIFEGIMCFGIPLLFMALHYIVQGHRYDVFEDFGCQATVYISIPAIFIIWFPPLLFSVITLIYAALALNNFIRRRLTFAAHLQNSNSALTTNRYLRLIAMSLTEMAWGTSLTAYNLWNNVSPGLRPWTTWADVHSNFSRVDPFPLSEVPPWFTKTMMLFWWTMPASSIIFFVFFGFGEEALKEYRRIWGWIRRNVFRRPEVEKTKKPFGILSPNSSHPPHSAFSHLSQSTITLAPSPGPTSFTHKSKFEEATKDTEYTPDAAPPYYASYPPTRTHIAVPIDPLRDTRSIMEPRASLVSSAPDETDTFTISTFSYYGAQPASPSSPTSTIMVPSSPAVVPHSLPPPPRRFPRQAPSSSSVRTAVSNAAPREEADEAQYDASPRPSSLVLCPPSPDGLDERQEIGTLGVPGGSILVTVHRQASLDRGA
ncbi:Pheromone B beta 1 receptor [Psilocybe cubensis]|uniref:Pheromone B beta 1 receptor n=1 Tax=Psilocybe cubensis TaxID=181762 RepID=A0ACB8GLQ0_PSICU|nr:Pheromone B beta 1 receptor [Psilocybe cubensis]KAH9476601.1 Pheromone B beta 1 receptor [Psilocybe cubensis]